MQRMIYLLVLLLHFIPGSANGKQDLKNKPELTPMATLTVFSLVTKLGTDPSTFLRASKIVEEIYSRIVLELVRLGKSEEEPATLQAQRSIDQVLISKNIMDLTRDGITLSDLTIEEGKLSFKMFDNGRKKASYNCFLVFDEMAIKDKGPLPKCA